MACVRMKFKNWKTFEIDFAVNYIMFISSPQFRPEAIFFLQCNIVLAKAYLASKNNKKQLHPKNQFHLFALSALKDKFDNQITGDVRNYKCPLIVDRSPGEAISWKKFRIDFANKYQAFRAGRSPKSECENLLTRATKALNKTLRTSQENFHQLVLEALSQFINKPLEEQNLIPLIEPRVTLSAQAEKTKESVRPVSTYGYATLPDADTVKTIEYKQQKLTDKEIKALRYETEKSATTSLLEEDELKEEIDSWQPNLWQRNTDQARKNSHAKALTYQPSALRFL